MSDYYKPQIQAGELQAQKDVHQLRLAEIAKGQREQEQLALSQEAARKIFGDTGVQAPPSAGIEGAAPIEEGVNYLPQISQQGQLASKQEKMGTFLATTGQLKQSEEMFKAARETRKASEDLANKQLMEQKRKAEQLGSILGPAIDGNSQESYDIAKAELAKVNPQFAMQLPATWNPSTAKLVNQLTGQATDRKTQIDQTLKMQKDKELQDYRKDRLEEQRQARIDRNVNQAENRELKMMLHKERVGVKKDVYTKDANAYTAEVTNLYKNVQKDIAKLNQKVRTRDLTPEQAKESIDELRSDYHRNIEAAADKYRARGVNIPQLYKGEATAPKVGIPTSTKPSSMSDSDWKEYQAYVKSQGGK